MFRRFQELRERDESGFTLIELLVVILIISILAAIAIPVFLQQRKKGWAAQAESAVKNMATAEESYATGNNGSYTVTLADLTTEGFKYSAADVTPAFAGANTASAGSTRYCMKATSTHDATVVYYYDSQTGAPATALPAGCTNS
jgi:type IV pilus assembly protein PilA